ncbi:hypothetical protein BO94DRAFT_623054 [Aspergillus sclerotioniger CBS 115572]|uniref:Protein kinase domain-containing protein n=1 Tax=Aspergillus sclerotioniger CBS 115572 TaxID=1450535 RepID=A0A317X3V1_9EURO|nr:hypothetical protein BO94DRAFT_623054 [Aspergillus sclerotioniger CBS 115572]PWY91638.1 hypothetical protein BO94DRAFT_623054 [Aspergillus sclerotioniger CBS 115572]
MEFDKILPSEIIFEKKLVRSKYSSIFLITLRTHLCIMKVHHGRHPPQPYDAVDREFDIHVREYTAYRRLQSKGLCGRIVPHLLGRLYKFNPSLCTPHLDHFTRDEYPPSAIFIEYIPGMEVIGLHNFSETRMDNFITGIQAIHQALVLHGDTKPRNMMVLKNEPERIMWIDFDRAETYDEDSITDRQRGFLAEEADIVQDLKDCFREDCITGVLKEAYLFYC